VLDRELTVKARAAAADLAEAERRVALSRAAYHTAVRRLHLAGASLREIAEALALSHQRVQQIVGTAGGSWWTRVWRTRRPDMAMLCTWCDRPPDEVSKLIAGPNVFICESCIEAAERALRGNGGAGLKRAAESARRRCAFCSKRTSRTRSLVVGPSADVCSDCLRVCREILDGRAA
jgi:ClpX C4-type zinc finger